MARKRKSLTAAASKEIKANFSLDAFKEKKGLKSNIKFKDQESLWVILFFLEDIQIQVKQQDF